MKNGVKITVYSPDGKETVEKWISFEEMDMWRFPADFIYHDIKELRQTFTPLPEEN